MVINNCIMFIIIRNNNCDVQMNIIEDLKQKKESKIFKNKY